MYTAVTQQHDRSAFVNVRATVLHDRTSFLSKLALLQGQNVLYFKRLLTNADQAWDNSATRCSADGLVHAIPVRMFCIRIDTKNRLDAGLV